MGKETPAQSQLFALVMNHPDVVASPHVVAPLTPEIASAFLDVVTERVVKLVPKQMGQKVEAHVERS